MILVSGGLLVRGNDRLVHILNLFKLTNCAKIFSNYHSKYSPPMIFRKHTIGCFCCMASGEGLLPETIDLLTLVKFWISPRLSKWRYIFWNLVRIIFPTWYVSLLVNLHVGPRWHYRQVLFKLTCSVIVDFDSYVKPRSFSVDSHFLRAYLNIYLTRFYNCIHIQLSATPGY